KLADSSIVDIAPDGADTFRWRKFDGTTGVLHRAENDNWRSTLGWTDRADGNDVSFSSCATGEIRLHGIIGHRIPLQVTDATFHSRDVDLVGRLVLPKGSEKVPIVVLVHGAEHDSARDSYSLQRLLPAEGVGAFVYDKRGTGASGGK